MVSVQHCISFKPLKPAGYGVTANFVAIVALQRLQITVSSCVWQQQNMFIVRLASTPSLLMDNPGYSWGGFPSAVCTMMSEKFYLTKTPVYLPSLISFNFNWRSVWLFSPFFPDQVRSLSRFPECSSTSSSHLFDTTHSVRRTFFEVVQLSSKSPSLADCSVPLPPYA